MSCDHSNQEPTLIIDFAGLCAFVADPGQFEEHPNAVYVLMVDTDKAAPKDNLCRHDPVMVFDFDSFGGAGENTDHIAFYNLNGRNVGLWNLRGKDLRLELVKEDTKTPLTLDDSFCHVLGLETLTRKTAGVKRRWATGWQVPGVATRLTIEHGTLSSLLQSDDWVPGKKDGTALGDPIHFNQLVRWTVDALSSKKDIPFVKLSAGPDEWVKLRVGHEPKKRGFARISNLCPLSVGGNEKAEDVLAFYDMAEDPVKDEDRLVLYPVETDEEKKDDQDDGSETRPGTDACPPIQGVLA